MCAVLTVFSFTELPRLWRGTLKHCITGKHGRGAMWEGFKGEGFMRGGFYSAHTPY